MPKGTTEPALTRGDPKELPVLRELLRSDNWMARLLAVWELGRLPNVDETVLSGIEEAGEREGLEDGWVQREKTGSVKHSKTPSSRFGRFRVTTTVLLSQPWWAN